MGDRRILRKVVCIILIGGVFVLSFFGCGGQKYKVDYQGEKDSFENAKDSYRAGAAVKIYYKYIYIATDTDYTFYLDSERLNPSYDDKKGFVISFKMPDHDVKLTVEHHNSMIAEPDITDAPEKRFEKEAKLSFHSFDGGGPEYSVKIDDPSIVSCTSRRDYGKKNHEVIDGAAYNVIFTLKGLKAGTTEMTVFAHSPIMEDEEYKYRIEVNDELMVSVQELPTENETTAVEEPEPET